MTTYILRDFVREAKKSKRTIPEVIIAYEKKHFSRTEKEIHARLDKSFSIFQTAIERGITGTYPFENLMFSKDSDKLSKTKTRILGTTLHKACIYALAITENNLNMGNVIACPTAGSSGIVPACILAISEDYFLTKEEKHASLLAASAIELSIIKNASISGAVHGCQAECGSASAMAAGAIVQLLHNTHRTCPDMIEHAAALALKNSLGLVCDPVAGIVSVPCRKRNATSVATAFVSAQLALAGITSYIPFDEVASAMNDIGNRMDDELKETARGGLAKTTTGRNWERLKDTLLQEARRDKVSFAEKIKTRKK